jgi:hypothetical protein
MTDLLSILAALFWIIAGPLSFLAGLVLTFGGWLDRDRRSALDGFKLTLFGLSVCAILVIWQNASR